MLKQYLNKGISTPLALVLILVLASIVGAFTLWQYSEMKKEETNLPEVKIPDKTTILEEESTSTQEIDTSGWKTYRNEEYGFEIKYPDEWILEKYGSYDVRVFPSKYKDVEEDYPYISIEINPNPQKLSIREFYSGTNERDLFSYSNNQYTTGTIAGRTYYKFIPYITYSGEVVVVIPLDSAFLEITDVGEMYQGSIFDTLLSTLKFIDKERYITILSPNGGESYRNGNKCIISWKSKGVSEVNIFLEEIKDERDYLTERKIAGNIPSREENYEWIIPEDLPPSKYIIFIESTKGGQYSAEDFSDDYFTVSGSLSVQEKERMLKQMFPSSAGIKGNEILSSSKDDYATLYLDKIIRGSFFAPSAEEYLFIVQLAGVGHTGGLYHAYLGVFNENKELITTSINFKSFGDLTSIANYHIGGDRGKINFFNCKSKGVQYIASIYGGCPTGSCCDDSLKVLKVDEGKFKVVQLINSASLGKGSSYIPLIFFPFANAASGPDYGLKMTFSGNDVIIKKVPARMIYNSDNPCPETDYKILKWNEETCRFELVSN